MITLMDDFNFKVIFQNDIFIFTQVWVLDMFDNMDNTGQHTTWPACKTELNYHSLIKRLQLKYKT